MKKTLLKEIKENRSRLIASAAALTVIIFASLCTYMAVHLITQKNDSLAANALSQLSYTEDAAESELKALQPHADTELLSVSSRGKLYRAMAELSYMTGDDMLYNQYIAFALFYLDLADDADSIFYLNNKYIGRLYANGCYDSASDVLYGLSEHYDINTFSPDMQASYYLSNADVAQMLGNDPSEYLSKANTAIASMEKGSDMLLAQAKHDLISARGCIQEGDFDVAKEIMAEYSESDDFGLGQDQVYVICDFRLPYYEIMAKLQLEAGDYISAYENTEKYINICDNYKFRAMKLRLLQYMNERGTDSEANQYEIMEKAVMSENLNEMTEKYGQFLLEDICNTTRDLYDYEAMRTTVSNTIIIGIIVLCAAILLFCIISVTINRMGKDGLTQLNSRKKFEHAKHLCEKKKTPHCLLMLDIDDFKKVNDTFGHAKGDDVLFAISEILLSYSGRGISSYRYGGEELCMIFLKVPEMRVRSIAEDIRTKVEHNVSAGEMHVTISGGIGVSTSGESVLNEADSRLYESKNNGKNQIR